MSIRSIAVCIPVHGASQALTNSLRSIDVYIRQWCESRNISCSLLVANSGSSLDLSKDWKGNCEIFQVPSNYYWGAAVQFLFEKAQSLDLTHVLLMNHDVLVEAESLANISELLLQYPNAVISAVSVTGVDRKIENAGFLYRNGTLPFSNPYLEDSLNSLPSQPYQVDSLNGRFVLFPAAAANPEFLVPNLVPHYFADTLLATKARRSGFPLVIATKSFVFSDQSDTEFKRSRQRCDTLQGLYKCLFEPYSYRYIWGNFWGQYMLVDNPMLGLAASLKYTLGRVIKSVLECSRILNPL